MQGAAPVVVAPAAGPAPPGAAFGPTTAGSATGGIQEALDSVAGRRGVVLLGPGVYLPQVPVKVPGNTELRFQQAEVRHPAGGQGPLFQVGNRPGIQLTGSVSFVNPGGPVKRAVLAGNGCQNLVLELQASFQGQVDAQPAIFLQDPQGFDMHGRFTSTDSPIVSVLGGKGIRIRDVVATYQRSLGPRQPVVSLMAGPNFPHQSDVVVENLDIDGNNVLEQSALCIQSAPPASGVTISDVQVRHVKARNILAKGNGLEITNADRVQLSDVQVSRVHFGICLRSSHVVADHLDVRQCRGYGICLGGWWQAFDISDLQVSDFNVEDCGLEAQDVLSGQVGIMPVEPPRRVDRVQLLRGTMGQTDPRCRYGFTAVGAGISGVTLQGVRLAGSKGAVLLDRSVPPQAVQVSG